MYKRSTNESYRKTIVKMVSGVIMINLVNEVK